MVAAFQLRHWKQLCCLPNNGQLQLSQSWPGSSSPGPYTASILDGYLGPTQPRAQRWLAGQQNHTQTPPGEERPAPGSHSSICRSKCRQCPQFSLRLSGRSLMPWLQIQVLKWRFCLGPTPPDIGPQPEVRPSLQTHLTLSLLQICQFLLRSFDLHMYLQVLLEGRKQKPVSAEDTSCQGHLLCLYIGQVKQHSLAPALYSLQQLLLQPRLPAPPQVQEHFLSKVRKTTGSILCSLALQE